MFKQFGLDNDFMRFYAMKNRNLKKNEKIKKNNGEKKVIK